MGIEGEVESAKRGEPARKCETGEEMGRVFNRMGSGGSETVAPIGTRRAGARRSGDVVVRGGRIGVRRSDLVARQTGETGEEMRGKFKAQSLG